MSNPVEEFYVREVQPLSDNEKRHLVELIARDLAARNGGAVSRNGGSAAVRSQDDAGAARQRLRRHAGAVSIGYPTGAENESIDADLCRECGSGSGMP